MYSARSEEQIRGSAYAGEPQRLLQLTNTCYLFQGNHEDYILTYADDGWHCSCATYDTLRLRPETPRCRHIWALEHKLASQIVPVELPAVRTLEHIEDHLSQSEGGLPCR
jgi:predicted nucleic acid-binding Zn finger protein